MYPELQGAFAPILDNLRDENISLNDRFASASATPGLIELAIGQSNKNKDFGLKTRELDIQEGNYIAKDRESQAAARSNAGKLELKSINVGGRTDVPVLVNAAGDMFSAQNQDPIVDMVAYANGKGGTLTNNLLPELTVDPNVPTPDPNFDYTQIPTVSGDAVPTPDRQVQAGLQAGVVNQQPQSNAANQVEAGLNAGNANANAPVPLGRPIGGDSKAETPMSAEQVQDLAIQGFRINARPLADGSFMVSGADIGGAGETIESSPEGGFKITRGGGGGAKAEAVAKAQQQTKNESFRLNQANTEEAFTRLDTAGTNNPVFAAGNALLAEALPASETGELAGFYERINSENSFIKMNQQRASSPTGGSAGSMTEKEWPRYEGRFSPLKTNAKKDTIAKSLSLNLLNSFEAVNGTPDDVIKLLNEKKIDQATYDNYVSDYITNRQIARVNANGVEGKSYEWTKLNKNLLSKSTIYEAPTTSGSNIGLDQGARDTLQEFLPKSK